MLSHSVTVYIPTTIHASAAPRSKIKELRDTVKRTLSILFGGYTETIGNGGWYSNELNKIISERVYLVKAYANDIQPLQLEQVKALCNQIKAELEQEAVSLEVNNTLEFI